MSDAGGADEAMGVVSTKGRRLTYCEAVWSQRKEDLIKGCENAMLYFEGGPGSYCSRQSQGCRYP